MQTQDQLLAEAETKLFKSITTVNKIGRLKIHDYELNQLKKRLARIQEILEDIGNDDKPEPENEARKALTTGDWGSFFDSLTQ